MHREVLNFATQIMRPNGIALDKLNDPADVIAKGSVLWDVLNHEIAAGESHESPSLMACVQSG